MRLMKDAIALNRLHMHLILYMRTDRHLGRQIGNKE